MNKTLIIQELQKKYPGKAIICNGDQDPTEILCEIEPTSHHPAYSTAVAIIDSSVPHVHKKTTENYTILKGELTLTIDDQQIILREGDTYVIAPNRVHSACGNETWVRVDSSPGWTMEDHMVNEKVNE